ncbi:MAG: phosphorylase [Deltaproteobacteria bacterium]
MKEQIIGLIAAMPEEISPLLKLVGAYNRSAVAGFNLYRFSLCGKSCLLMEAGIGLERAGRAAEALIASARPDCMISFGFGGAVRPGMAVGDLAVARSSRLYQGDNYEGGETILLKVSANIMRRVEAISVKQGCAARQGDFLTTAEILSKRELVKNLLPDLVSPVLDMETWAVARTAHREDIPFLAIRAISDASDEELGFSISEFTDSKMNIRIPKILRTIALKPHIIPQLIRLARNSRIAGRNLAALVKELLQNDIASEP